MWPFIAPYCTLFSLHTCTYTNKHSKGQPANRLPTNWFFKRKKRSCLKLVAGAGRPRALRSASVSWLASQSLQRSARLSRVPSSPSSYPLSQTNWFEPISEPMSSTPCSAAAAAAQANHFCLNLLPAICLSLLLQQMGNPPYGLPGQILLLLLRVSGAFLKIQCKIMRDQHILQHQNNQMNFSFYIHWTVLEYSLHIHWILIEHSMVSFVCIHRCYYVKQIEYALNGVVA